MDCARNIITANFSGGGTSATTAPLWQWDYGQALCITGIDLPAAFEVHFSTNKTGGVSTVAVGADGQVTIPNVLLTIGKNINAWIYLSDAQGEGETEYSILIPVKARPMPETYDAEVSVEFDDVVRQVSEYAETAQAAADNAGASASAAEASASEAAASASAAEAAKTAAETAQGKAEDAQAAAETAAQTATEKAQQTAQDAAQAAQSKADAESAAGMAEAAQTGAESAKTDAETAAQGAADSASAASASATSAGQAATSATQSATSAAGSATTAQGAAQTAITKAGEASASADAAAASETAAQTAQQGAEAAETNAGQSASTATTKAAEAATSASNAAASESAAEAAATRAETAAATLTVDDALSSTSTNPVQNKVITESVTQLKSAIDALKIVDTASGAIASFPDGAAMPMESLTVEMSPIQDLHGQDAPYPAGGGKNLVDWVGPQTITSQTTFAEYATSEQTQFTASITAAKNNEINGQLNIYAYNGNTLAKTGRGIISSTTAKRVTVTIDLVDIVYTSLRIVLTGVSGGYSITCSDLQLERGSEATSYAPYENLCPISGRDSVTVTRTGVNVWDEEWEDGAYSTATGTKVNRANAIRSKNYIPVYPGMGIYMYCASHSVPGDGILMFYNKDKTFLLYKQSALNRVHTVPSNAWYMTFYIAPETTYHNDVSINYPSTDHDYHPGNVQSVTVQLGQTVYGGKAEIISGQGESAMALVDLGSFNWSYDSTYKRFFTLASQSQSLAFKRPANNNEIANIVNDRYRTVTDNQTSSSRYNCSIGMSVSGRLDIRDESFDSDVTAFEASLSGVKLCYELTTPQTITLDPVTLSTLKGQNNVWSDADSVTVDYVADPKLYNARLTEPDADMVADANITSGHYFMVGNSLFLATSNIASGAAIVPGVNCTRTNLAAALNAINA